MQSVVDRIQAAIKRVCLQILAEGQGMPHEIDSAWLEIFGDMVVAPCRSMDADGLDSVVLAEEKYLQEPASHTNSLDYLRKSYIEKGRLGDKCAAGGLYPAHRNAKTPTLYFLDIAGEALHDITKAGHSGRVLSGGFDGRPLRVIAENQLVPDSLDISPSLHRLFWTNMGIPGAGNGHIKSSNLDGSDIRTIVASGSGGIRTPKQLTIDHTNDTLYFCDREGLAVMRCALDGSALEPLVRTGDPGSSAHAADASRWCVGVAIDRARGHLYWSQKGPSKGSQGRICRAGLDMRKHEHPGGRSDIETLFHNLPECVDLELDADASMLYWADRGEVPLGNSLNRGYVGPDRAAYLANAHPLERKLGYVVLAKMLHEPISVKLDKVDGYIYATDMGGAIYRFGLDGQGRKRVYEYLGVYTGLALTHG